MKEELISFETAKLAKEKRFREKVYWYCTYKRKIPTNEQSFYPDLGEYKDYNNDIPKFYKYFSLPTQSLLQRWLREEHDLDILIYKSDVEEYIFHVWGETNRQIKSQSTYEQALEKGLQEALKLIK